MAKRCLMIASLCMLLAACSSSVPDQSSQSNQPAQPTQTAQTEQSEQPELPEQSEQPEQPAQSAATQPQVTKQPPAATPSVPAIAETATFTYYMNQNYIIVPKEETTERKVVLLTFDDGPKDEETLTDILDTLDQHAAKAIFFVNGYRVKQNPELLKLIHERGQTIGNHSWDHIDLKKLTESEVDSQIKDVQTIVEELTGESPAFFRPPFGSGNDYVKEKAAEEGMLYMTWSNGSQDWVKGYNSPDKIIDSVLDQLHPGSNILMHELPWTAEGLDDMLTSLKERGYSFIDPALIDPDYSKN